MLLIRKKNYSYSARLKDGSRILLEKKVKGKELSYGKFRVRLSKKEAFYSRNLLVGQRLVKSMKVINMEYYLARHKLSPSLFHSPLQRLHHL